MVKAVLSNLAPGSTDDNLPLAEHVDHEHGAAAMAHDNLGHVDDAPLPFLVPA